MGGSSPLDACSLSEKSDHISKLLAEVAEDNELILGFEVLNDDQWLVRMSGTDKEFITVFLDLRQRSLQFSSYFMPAPAENQQAVYRSVLRQNNTLRGICFSIGKEEALYLKGEVPSAQVDASALDHILGSVYEATERMFCSLRQQAFASRLKDDSA